MKYKHKDSGLALINLPKDLLWNFVNTPLYKETLTPKQKVSSLLQSFQDVYETIQY